MGSVALDESTSTSRSAQPGCFFGDVEVDCVLDDRVWNGDCYWGLVEPQPPASDPVWQGRTDGAVYECRFHPGYPAPDGLSGTGGYLRWLPEAPEPDLVDPAVLAQEAVESMNLRAVDIGIAPPSGADSLAYVGLPVYLWVAEPSAQTWGPNTATASAGSVTVTATARVERVDWSMGDGTTVSCTTTGTVYDPRYGDEPSPTCGHTYDRTSAAEPDRTYLLTATSRWAVDWSGAGQAGTIRLDLSRSTELRVGEIQTLRTA